MSERKSLLGDMSWLQVAGSVLAAVTSAWIASSLGVAGTLIGVAVGSLVASISSAFYSRTLDKGRTLLVQTASGTVLQERVDADGHIESIEPAGDDVTPEEIAAGERKSAPPFRWKPVAIMAVAVLVLSLGAISAYEAVSGKSLDGSSRTTIGKTVIGDSGSSRDKPDEPAPTDQTQAPDDVEQSPQPTPGQTTAPTKPAPTVTTPAPTATTPTAPSTPEVPEDLEQEVP